MPFHLAIAMAHVERRALCVAQSLFCRPIGVVGCRRRRRLNVLAEPPESLAVTLSHDDGAHEELNGSNVLERHLALASRLVQTECLAELFFADGAWCVDFVSEDQEGHLVELLDAQEGVQLCSRLLETLVVGGINEEHDSVYFWEVILPQSTCCAAVEAPCQYQSAVGLHLPLVTHPADDLPSRMW